MKSKKKDGVIFGLLASAVLAASGCSSSGGGSGSGTGEGVVSGGSSNSGTVPFTSFSELNPNTEYELDGITTGLSYEYDVEGLRVTSLGSSTIDEESYIVIGYGERFLERLALDGSFAGFDIDSSLGGQIIFDEPLILIFSGDGEVEGAFIDADYSGWDYQSFGTWRTGVGTGSGYVGSTSAGFITPFNDIPQSGTARYAGRSLGQYVDPNGLDYISTSAVEATADFSRRFIELSSSGTVLIDPYFDEVISSPGLDMSGTLSFDRANNIGSGQISTSSGLAGRADSRFYGPNAEEIGGIFDLKGSGLETYTGAFGASR